MGQTLTHGIYLPDEGERNCYSGLAANWQLLDGAVGTIAEHTTALAGKAPAVHTHTKSDITDFPAYGTTAGTICEGNDSRLSDARTPVAHTHTKSDVTDLFNSANTWTGNNSFSKTLNIYNSNSAGTTPALYLKSSKSVIGTTSGSEADIQKIAVLDKNGNTVSENTTCVYSAGSSWVVNAVYTTDSSDNVISSQISHYIYKNGRRVLRPDTDTDLGTSANQWNNLYAKRVNTKSVNGENPGALSLPNGNNSDSIAVDITDWYIQDPDYPDDPTKKILDATNHKVDTAVPGWLHINFPNVAGNWAYVRKYAAGTNMDSQRIADGNASSDFANVSLTFPIYSSCYVRIKAKTATVRIFPCIGNV